MEPYMKDLEEPEEGEPTKSTKDEVFSSGEDISEAEA